MRARYARAEAYARAEHPVAAIEEAETLLTLDREDHLGIRYRLLGLYLERGLVRKVRGVFKRYSHEHTATFAWALVLERWLSDAVTDAEVALRRARRINPYAEPYLADRRRTPRACPDTVEFGGEDEAVSCAQDLGAAWARQGQARAWLRAARAAASPGSRPRRTVH